MKRNVLILLGLFALCWSALAATAKKKAQPSAKSKATATSKKRTVSAKTKSSPKSATVTTRKKRSSTTRVRSTTTYNRRARRSYSPWSTPSFADPTVADSVDGEDLVVRRAAVDALGRFNGTVVVADPNTGRILTIVNQKLGLTGAYTPCSTIKLMAGTAGLMEGIVERDTKMRLSRSLSMDLTYALAKSNNPYFANIGEKLGFERVNYYGKLFGLGERAGLNIEGESAGVFPDEKPKGIPLGMMTSFGTGIGLTPLQLTAMVSAIANGGTLYYLQYPRSAEEAATFTPQVKRYLDVQQALPDLRPGMQGATEIGTARRAFYDASEPIMGKTGTCTDTRTHLGWFGSYNEVNGRKLVVVVLLTGGRQVSGPVASGVAGQVYRNLSQQQYFARTATTASTPTTVTEGTTVQ